VDARPRHRRRFLKAIGQAGAISSLWATGVPAAQLSPTRRDDVTVRADTSWDEVRRLFELRRDRIHMAGMVMASHPAPVTRAIESHRSELQQDPVRYIDENRWRLEGDVLKAAAHYFKASPQDIALTGFQAKGYLVASHLEYRIGVFQGLQEPMAENGLRYAGRVQYNVWDTETSFFYPGTYLGTKKILAVGTAFDRQKDDQAYASDVFVDYPLRHGTIAGQFDHNRFDGGATLRTLSKQNDVLLELGYFTESMKLMPVLQFARRHLVDTSRGDENRISVGANYWWAGHNANIKAAYTRIDPAGLATQREFTIQLQVFYF
jgi:hypothetical protein